MEFCNLFTTVYLRLAQSHVTKHYQLFQFPIDMIAAIYYTWCRSGLPVHELHHNLLTKAKDYKYVKLTRILHAGIFDKAVRPPATPAK